VGIDTTSLLLNYGALGVVLILLLTGVVVPGFVYRKLERENETYRDALSVGQQRNADLQQFAVTGQKAIVALTEVAEERRRGNTVIIRVWPARLLAPRPDRRHRRSLGWPASGWAAEEFADEVATGRVPSVRMIRARLHVGQPRAQRVRAYLAALGNP